MRRLPERRAPRVDGAILHNEGVSDRAALPVGACQCARCLALAHLPPSGVHIFRHSAAKLRRDAGESIEDVSRFLDQSSLAVTTVYLRRLEGQQDTGWCRVAAALGV